MQNQCSIASLLGGCFTFFVRCRAGIYPPTFFSPGPAQPIPPAEGGGGRRGNININDTMTSCRGSRAIIAPRAVRLILSGIPLSLINIRYIFEICPVYQREGDPERSMKFLGAWRMGVGQGRWFVSFFFSSCGRCPMELEPPRPTHG